MLLQKKCCQQKDQQQQLSLLSLLQHGHMGGSCHWHIDAVVAMVSAASVPAVVVVAAAGGLALSRLVLSHQDLSLAMKNLDYSVCQKPRR